MCFDLAPQAAALGEQFQQTLPQRYTGFAAQFEKGIQLPAKGGFDGGLRDALEQPGIQRSVQIKDVLADGHAAMG